MKKRCILASLIVCLALLVCVGCEKPAEEVKNELNCEFADVLWTRHAEHDVEMIRFGSDGSFTYYCACGNPVNDSDLCEGYTYDEETKTIRLNYIEETEEMVDTITVVSYSETELILDFDGEIRSFVPDGTKIESSVDFTKISPMIEENVNADVIVAAQKVIEAFLNYEESVEIEVSGDVHRFVNDMGYVINCKCPLFSAFADFDEMTAYDAETGTVSWSFYVSEDMLNEEIERFEQTTEEMLSVVEENDEESMKAILLYYALTKDVVYDEEILGANYQNIASDELALRESGYSVIVNKSGICTNIAQALMYLYTQAGLECGTVLHTGGAGMHMWCVVKIDGEYYYCDPTWDIGGGFRYFGITALDRSEWAGGYSEDDGTMLSIVVPNKYEISDMRFEELRDKVPVEITTIETDKENQTITFNGYDYQYTFDCY